MSRRKKRFWADEEKREICRQATTPGVSVAQVARRYAVNANLIFKWLKDPRFAPAADGPDQDVTFLPVEIEAITPHETAALDLSPPPSPSSPLSASRVDITLSDRRRILIEGPTALTAVISLVQGWRFDPGAEQYAGLVGGGHDGHAAGLQYAGGTGREGSGA